MSQSQRFGSRSEEPFPCPSAAGPVVTQDPRAATLVLMVGLPAAGKTTRAKELAATHQALRLTPDHWMIPLFGDSMADGKRWLLEGRLISLALQALRLGTSVVLDYGLWGRDERSALRWLARSAGAACQVAYLPVDKDVQLASDRGAGADRMAVRNQTSSGSAQTPMRWTLTTSWDTSAFPRRKNGSASSPRQPTRLRSRQSP
jgi:predicted kinase